MQISFHFTPAVVE